MELHLSARQMALWQTLQALAREQLMGMTMQLETTGTVDPALLASLTEQLALSDGLADERLTQRVLALLVLAQNSAGLASQFAARWQVEDAVATFGTPQQRQQYLTPQTTFGLAALPLRVTDSSTVKATPVTAGWQLTGTVKAVLNAGQATDYLVLARTRPARS